MTGNGSAHLPRTSEGKLFTILDAILGVILFAAVIGALVIPVFHWMLHGFYSRHQDTHQKREQATVGAEEPHSVSTGERT